MSKLRVTLATLYGILAFIALLVTLHGLYGLFAFWAFDSGVLPRGAPPIQISEEAMEITNDAKNLARLVFVLAAVAATILTFEAYAIYRKKYWTFSVVIAFIELCIFPFGTLLGVATILYLFSDTVKDGYSCSIESTGPIT